MSGENMSPLRFANEIKLRKQMRKRKIDESMIREALTAIPEVCSGKLGPARRYRSAATGIVVVVDERTDEIFHLGRPKYRYDDI